MTEIEVYKWSNCSYPCPTSWWRFHYFTRLINLFNTKVHGFTIFDSKIILFKTFTYVVFIWIWNSPISNIIPTLEIKGSLDIQIRVLNVTLNFSNFIIRMILQNFHCYGIFSVDGDKKLRLFYYLFSFILLLSVFPSGKHSHHSIIIITVNLHIYFQMWHIFIIIFIIIE